MTQPELSMGYPGFEHDRAWRRLTAPKDYRNPEPRERYHLVVIGAGPAGLVIAIGAAGLGAKVALVEKQAMGGDCLNVGCVPSKSLLEHTAGGRRTFDEAYSWMRSVRAKIAEHDSVERYRSAGVDVFLGSARFIDERSVAVDGAVLVGRRIAVATGARAALPPIPGLADAKPLTNETVFDLDRQPRRLAIIGGGPIGCELAQAFARMGTEVHLLEAAERLLANETCAAGEIVARALQKAGVTVRLSAAVAGVSRRGSRIAIETADETLSADQVLVAAGRRANTDELNLAAVGVEADAAEQIIVDKYLRSTNRRIFAAGDVCSRLKFTHHADAQARIVVQNALFFPSATTTRLIVPHCTYTDPEVAQVGRSEADLARLGIPYDRFFAAYGDLDRGRTQGDEDGFVEILTRRHRAEMLGATIVGRDAGEQIALLCLAMAHGFGIDRFGKALFAYPTRAEVLKRLADDFNRGKLTPRAKSLFARWFRWTL